MVRGIVIWGVVALVAAIASGILAMTKNRDVSAWSAWGFLLPPVVLIFLLVPKHLGPRTRRRTLDEEDAAQARADGM